VSKPTFPVREYHDSVTKLAHWSETDRRQIEEFLNYQQCGAPKGAGQKAWSVLRYQTADREELPPEYAEVTPY
jgi:hypothetical protein